MTLTITANTEPYYLPTPPSDANAQRVLSILQTYYCINRCNPLDKNGYAVDVTYSGSDYLIRHYDPETNTDEDESLVMALFQWNSGNAQSQASSTLRGVRAFMTNNQNFSNNTPAFADFNSEDFDTDGFITPTSNTFTIPIDLAGYYQISLSVVVYVNGGTGVYWVPVDIVVNGVDEQSYFTATRDLQAGSVNGSTVLYLEAESTVKIQVEFQGTGATDRVLSSGSLVLRHVGI